MPSRYPIVELPIFLGLNSQDDPFRLKEGELVLCTNMLPLSDYSVERVAGYTDKLTSDLGTTLTLSAYEHELWDGTKAVFFVYGTGLYVLDTGEATATLIKSGLTQDSKMRYVSYGNYVWCGNGFDANMVITPYYIHKINRAVVSVTPTPPTTLAHVKDWYNAIAADYELHRASTTEHVIADATNALSDVSLAGGDSQGTTDAALNDLKAKFNTHRTATGIHNVADSYHIITAADSSSEATSITLVQDIYYNYIGHTGDGRVLPWGVTAPASAMTATKATGTGLEIGVYLYVLTYVDKVNGWESGPSASVSVTTTTGDQKVNLTAIPISTQANVTHKRIYRTTVGGASYFRVAEIANNLTVYTYDTTPDASLGAQITTEGNAITPSCSIFFIQNDRIYMAGSVMYPAFLYWTETSNPHLYMDADNYKGYEIAVTGVGGLPTGLLIFEYHRTWYEAGMSPSTWSTVELSRDIGCVSHDSITSIEGTLVYEDAYGRQTLTQPTVWMSPLGAYATTGGEPFTISYKINKTLVTKNLSSAVIVHDPAQNHVYFIVASS